MEWSERFATGIERLDEQHRMIFRMASDFREALERGEGGRVYPVMLRSLAVYVRAHFGFEEECMTRYRCPVAERNQEAHARFADTLAGFERRLAEHGFDPTDAAHLVETVELWLSDHICRIDVQLKPLVEDA